MRCQTLMSPKDPRKSNLVAAKRKRRIKARAATAKELSYTPHQTGKQRPTIPKVATKQILSVYLLGARKFKIATSDANGRSSLSETLLHDFHIIYLTSDLFFTCILLRSSASLLQYTENWAKHRHPTHPAWHLLRYQSRVHFLSTR